jgi:hypothetical protein
MLVVFFNKEFSLLNRFIGQYYDSSPQINDDLLEISKSFTTDWNLAKESRNCAKKSENEKTFVQEKIKSKEFSEKINLMRDNIKRSDFSVLNKRLSEFIGNMSSFKDNEDCQNLAKKWFELEISHKGNTIFCSAAHNCNKSHDPNQSDRCMYRHTLTGMVMYQFTAIISTINSEFHNKKAVAYVLDLIDTYSVKESSTESIKDLQNIEYLPMMFTSGNRSKFPSGSCPVSCSGSPTGSCTVSCSSSRAASPDGRMSDSEDAKAAGSL